MAVIDNLSDTQHELDEMIGQTTMDVRFLTYIRPVNMGEGTGYAVCTEEGAQLAVFASAEAAFFSARQHNLIPMRIH